MHCAFSEMVPLDKILSNPRNPNVHPRSQIELLTKVISEQGWRAPITVSRRSGFVVRGHGRLEAAKQLGAAQAPVDYQDYSSEELELADLIADNRIAELAHIDGNLLSGLIEDLAATDLDIELTGYDTSDLDSILEEFGSIDLSDDGEGEDSESEHKEDKTMVSFEAAKCITCPNCGKEFAKSRFGKKPKVIKSS